MSSGALSDLNDRGTSLSKTIRRKIVRATLVCSLEGNHCSN